MFKQYSEMKGVVLQFDVATESTDSDVLQAYFKRGCLCRDGRPEVYRLMRIVGNDIHARVGVL